MDIYEILNRLSSIDNEATRAAVDQLKSLNKIEEGTAVAEKYQAFKKKDQDMTEAAKPDFLDLDRDGNKTEPMKRAAKEKKVEESTEEEIEEGSTGDYSAKKARAGKDIGKPGKQFAKIAKSAGERYGSKERGEKVAGAVLAKLRAKESIEEADMEEGNDFTGARLAAIKAGKPTFTVGGKTFKVTGDTSDEKVMEKVLWPGTPEYEKKFPKELRPGEKKKSSTGGEIEKTATGLKHTAKAADDDESDDKLDHLKGPKIKGRPKGSKRATGAKVKGTSKLHRQPAIKEQGMEDEEISVVDQGEYDREGDMAREQLHTVMDAAKELHSILDADENLPEWVQSKITKALDYLDTARDYVKASDAEDGEEIMPERKLTKPEMSKREKYVKSMKKSKGDFEKRYGERGEEVMYATATKMAKKKAEESKEEEEIEETTTSGSVATASTSGKGKGIFGKGVYEAEFEKALNSLMESVSVNITSDDNGQKNVTVTASDADAEGLSRLLQMAGLFGSGGYESACPTCGQTPCGCQEAVEEDYANTPEEQVKDTDFMVNKIAGGLNAPKTTGQTTIPVINTDPARQTSHVAEESDVIKRRLFDLYKKYGA